MSIIPSTAACIQITTIDIGGGLSANYCTNEAAMPGRSFSDYAAALAAAVPELFTGEFHVITEFGRALMAKVMIAKYTLTSVIIEVLFQYTL
jgi:diaminopimelate decarboxylase